MKTAENSTTPRGLNLRPPRLVLEEIPIIPAADCGPATDSLSTLIKPLARKPTISIVGVIAFLLSLNIVVPKP